MKFFLSALAVIVLILGITFWMNSDEDPPPLITDPRPPTMGIPTSEKDSLPTPGAISKPAESPDKKSTTGNDKNELRKINPDYPTLEMRLEEMTSRRNGRSFDPDAVLAAMQKNTAWESGIVDVDKLELSEEEMRDGREFIHFDRLKLETLMVGDKMGLPINQTGQTYQTRIENAQSNPDGSVTWKGELMDGEAPIDSRDGQKYEISITSGNRMVSGGIFTPEGHFVIEAVDDQGWIADAGTLFKFDPDVPDFIIPPAAKQ